MGGEEKKKLDLSYEMQVSEARKTFSGALL